MAGMRIWRRRPKRPPTYLEYERDLYARGELSLEKFEWRAGELLETGYADKPRTVPIAYTPPNTRAVDAVLKAILQEPIFRDVPKAPAVMGRATR